MTPYGRRNKFFYNYVDSHPRRNKGYINWWECEIGYKSNKKTTRQVAKKTIIKCLSELS